MKDILMLAGSAETAVESGLQLLEKQQVDRTEYKTQQGDKTEISINTKLIRYENVIGRGGFSFLM
jgi:hypothetical protein